MPSPHRGAAPRFWLRHAPVTVGRCPRSTPGAPGTSTPEEPRAPAPTPGRRRARRGPHRHGRLRSAGRPAEARAARRHERVRRGPRRHAGAVDPQLRSRTSGASTRRRTRPASADDRRRPAATALQSSVDIGYDFGEDRGQRRDDAKRVSLHLEDLDAAELRLVDGLLYARADVEGLRRSSPSTSRILALLVRAHRRGMASQRRPRGWLPHSSTASAFPRPPGLPHCPGVLRPDRGGRRSARGPFPTRPMIRCEVRDLFGKRCRTRSLRRAARVSIEELGDHLVAGLDLRKACSDHAPVGPPRPVHLVRWPVRWSWQFPPVAEIPAKQIDVSVWVRRRPTRSSSTSRSSSTTGGHLVLRADVRAPEEIHRPARCRGVRRRGTHAGRRGRRTYGGNRGASRSRTRARSRPGST